MKLYRFSLLIFFLYTILFVGVVSSIFATTTDQIGPYIAQANAYRSGGINNDRLHVNLWAMAECRGGASGTTLEVNLTVNGKPHLDKTPTKVIYHGSGYLVDKLRSTNEENGARSEAITTGNSSLAGTVSVSAVETVGVMPPPPPDPDVPYCDCPCDSVGLESVSGLYTATSGETHETCLMTDAPYSEVYWYVASPSETGLGTHMETDTGDGTTTEATFSYTFPSGAMHTGTYTITAYIYRLDQSVYQESYTVEVSSD